MQYSHRQSWAGSAQPPRQTNHHPGKKRETKKYAITTKKTHSKEGRAPGVPKGGEGKSHTSQLEKAGVAAHTWQSGAGKLVKVVKGGKVPRGGVRPLSM
jgi:hypothetical protein